MTTRYLLSALAISSSFAGTAQASIMLTNTTNITLAHAQVESGGDTSDDPNVVNGVAGALRPYTASGVFNCCGPNYLASNLNDGDIGVGIPSDGTYAIPNAGTLTLNFSATTTLGSIAIYNGYGNRDNGSYTLKDGSGNVLGAYTISGTGGFTNNGVDSFWLTFNTPVTTNALVFNTTSTDAQNTNSYREIQVFGNTNTNVNVVPEPAALALVLLGLAGMGCTRRRGTPTAA